MAVKNSREVDIEATPEQILDVIADVEATPTWAPQYKRAEVLDILCVGKNRRRQSVDLSAAVALVRLIEQGANVFMHEQSPVHRLGDGWTVRGKSRNRRFDERDRFRAKRIRTCSTRCTGPARSTSRWYRRAIWPSG